MTYAEKLKNPKWQKKRLQIMSRDGFKCADCGDETSSLAVHHAYYVSGRSPWMYPDWSLTTVCDECHRHRHQTDIESYHQEPENCNGAEWEAVIGFLGIRNMVDFENWWDLSVMLADRSEEFEARKIEPIQWLMWAYQSYLEQENPEIANTGK